MAISSKGLVFTPAPPPQSGGEVELRRWALEQFQRIALSLREGRSNSLRLDVNKVLPERPFSGLACYFAAGVAGAQEGLYEYRSGSWQKL